MKNKKEERVLKKKKERISLRNDKYNTSEMLFPFSDKGRHILDHFCMYTPINNKGIVENNLLFIKRKKTSIDFHFQRCKIFEKIII